MRETFTIADSFDATAGRLRTDMDAPLPLGHTQAIRRAMQLRAKGGAWTFTVIAQVMGEYHGFWRSAGWWRVQLRSRGVEARPHGAAFVGRQRGVAA